MSLDFAQNPLLAAALGYAARGWHVFPIAAGTKGRDPLGRSTHLLQHGHNDASNDPDRIREWWRRWPDANIGLNLAASGLVAVDPDLYKPDCEWASFIEDRDVPDTLVQDSPRGGKHYIFRAMPDARFRGTLCPGVEIKHKGYILLEPSCFDGAFYRFATDHDPAPAPLWLLRSDEQERPNSKPGKKAGAPSHRQANLVDSTACDVEVEDLLSWIDPDADGYHGWIEVLQALHDHYGGGPDGLALAEAWSSRGAKYKPGEVAAKWLGFKVGGGITLRTIAGRAGRNGADLSEIARRQQQPRSRTSSDEAPDVLPDLSHDQLALELGRRSWDANARYVALWGKWLFWKGAHWQRDETLEHLSRTRSFLRNKASGLLDWADRKTKRSDTDSNACDKGKPDSWARDQARVLRSNATVAAVGNLARANPASAVTHEAFDADHMLLGTPGGTVDLRTGTLRPARRADMISRLTTCVPAEPGATAPLWIGFLNDVFEGDAETIAFLQRAAGYALTGSTCEHKLLFLHGSGRNGKSVFLNTLLDLWGEYGRRVAATTFLHAQTERHPTDVAGLHGARLAIASELPRGKTWDEAVIKDLTGGDRLTARFMRQDFFDFEPQLTLMIAGNTQPSFRGVDEAIRSRVVLVPFTVTLPLERRDRALPEKLKEEGPAILRWCIDGALAWRERGLEVPQSIAEASNAYFDEEDTVGQFLQDETHMDPHAFAAAGDLILRFNQWSDGQGLAHWSQRTLAKELRQRGYQDAKSNGRRGFKGLSIR